MKMIIRSIDDGKLLKENDANSNSNMYGSIIDWLFHTVHIFSNVIMLISMLKSVQALAHSNTYSNTYIRVAIEQLRYYKAMKFKILSTHAICVHLKQSGIFLGSNCITGLQQFSVYKF